VLIVLYPLKFTPVYKSTIWGGRNIGKKFNRSLPDGKIAESWEVCCRKEGMSVVSNGIYRGMPLDDLIETYKDELLGKNVYNPSLPFPLLIKIIDANDKLSVQVHPYDNYKGLGKGETGKTEMWYIIDAKPDAELIYGLKEGITKENFVQAVNSNNIQSVLNFVPVKKGDWLFIPSGTVHAILDGILIAEIQQNSNTTYRVYDWDRVDGSGKHRDLHIDKSLDVINFTGNTAGDKADTTPVIHKSGLNSINELAKNQYFTIEEIDIMDKYDTSTDCSMFHIYMTLDGTGIVEYKNGSVDLNAGDTVFIPASLGQYEIKGKMKVLKVYI
jgi:mannose-6-phosphate isomerase, class I